MTDGDLKARAAKDIIEAGAFLHERGWVPATSGNFSARLDAERALVTVSGKHKGGLTADDLLEVDMTGRPLESGKRPSAETALHTALYRFFPEVGAVLHTHSVQDTVISRLHGDAAELALEDYEVLKAFSGVRTHQTVLRTPVFANTQDMDALALELADRLRRQPEMRGFLIRGHGLYAWGAAMADARRHVEAYQFLFSCELEMRRIGA